MKILSAQSFYTLAHVVSEEDYFYLVKAYIAFKLLFPSTHEMFFNLRNLFSFFFLPPIPAMIPMHYMASVDKDSEKCLIILFVLYMKQRITSEPPARVV